MDLRHAIRLVEAALTPQWFLNGEPVVDPASVNDDANDILEDDEWDWEWRLCDVPVSVFEPIHKPDFVALHAAMDGEDYEDDSDSETRLERIRAKEHYDPLIVALYPTHVWLMDGHHRLWVLAKERGLTTVKALVGKAQ